MNQRLQGSKGEGMAVRFLEESGYEVIGRNYSCKLGEVDIIAKDLVTHELVFVEVKTRWNNACGYPEEAVHPKKLRSVCRVAQMWIEEKIGKDTAMRVDVIAIEMDGSTPKFTHLKNVTF